MSRSRNPIKAAERRERAQRRVGEGAACGCGEKRPEALISGRKEAICYECDAKQRGKSTYEAHHVAGRANSATTIDVPANDHRAELSTAQYEWPNATLRNTKQSGRLANAASIRGVIDTVKYLMHKELLPIAEEFEADDADALDADGND